MSILNSLTEFITLKFKELKVWYKATGTLPWFQTAYSDHFNGISSRKFILDYETGYSMKVN